MGVHFSSKTVEWATPQDFFDKLDLEFHFTVDLCATPENAKCRRFYTKSENGLVQTWTGTCWLNPPYGKTIGLWLSKAREAALAGATVVALIPARTDTKWWHGICHGRERDSIFARPLAFRRMQTFRAIPERGRYLEAVPMTIYALVTGTLWKEPMFFALETIAKARFVNLDDQSECAQR